MDSSALYKLSYGLHLISSVSEGKDNGCIINTLTQVTSSPARLTAAVNKDNFTAELIARSGQFAATVLTEATEMDLIARFGFQSGREVDKFNGISFARDLRGIPYVEETMAAVFSCKVIDRLDVGSHLLFLGEIEEAKVLDNQPPMTYAYYHTVKKGTTPKNAPSYQEAPAQRGFRCTVCGHIEPVDTLLQDFICPVCKQPRDVFVKL